MYCVKDRLKEELCKYFNLYDSSSTRYKDYQMVANLWQETATNLGVDTPG